MALLFCDGFDHYAAADINKKWGNSGSWQTISAGQGRFGTAAIYCQDVTPLTSPTVTNTDVMICGFAYRWGTASSLNRSIPAFNDGGNGVQVYLRLNSNYSLQAYRGDGTTLGTGTTKISLGAWYYLEIKVLIDNTNGGFWLKVNGADELRLGAYAVSPVGLDTQYTANAIVNSISFTGSGYGGEYLDDVYICDDSGSTNNDFLGDIRVETIVPTGAGNTTQWTPSAGNNWDCVNDIVALADTDYVSETTASEKDTYAFGNLTPTSGTIKGVQIMIGARKDDAGSRSIAPVYRPTSTDYDGTTGVVSDSYTYLSEIKEVSPETSAAWTIAEINGAEFGVKLIS
jgi:hypothetical protein